MKNVLKPGRKFVESMTHLKATAAISIFASFGYDGCIGEPFKGSPIRFPFLNSVLVQDTLDYRGCREDGWETDTFSFDTRNENTAKAVRDDQKPRAPGSSLLRVRRFTDSRQPVGDPGA